MSAALAALLRTDDLRRAQAEADRLDGRIAALDGQLEALGGPWHLHRRHDIEDRLDWARIARGQASALLRSL